MPRTSELTHSHNIFYNCIHIPEPCPLSINKRTNSHSLTAKSAIMLFLQALALPVVVVLTVDIAPIASVLLNNVCKRPLIYCKLAYSAPPHAFQLLEVGISANSECFNYSLWFNYIFMCGRFTLTVSTTAIKFYLLHCVLLFKTVTGKQQNFYKFKANIFKFQNIKPNFNFKHSFKIYDKFCKLP